MSKDDVSPAAAPPSTEATPAATPEASTAVVQAATAEKLDGIEDIDFLLEEIENKIAPLALA